MSITRDCTGAPRGGQSSTRAAEEREQMQPASLCLRRGLENGNQPSERTPTLTLGWGQPGALWVGKGAAGWHLEHVLD